MFIRLDTVLASVGQRERERERERDGQTDRIGTTTMLMLVQQQYRTLLALHADARNKTTTGLTAIYLQRAKESGNSVDWSGRFR